MSDASLTAEQQLIRQTVRQFAQTEVRAVARRMDEEDWWPDELVPKLGSLGLLGMTVPQDLGGAGMDAVSAAIAVEELARESGGLCLSVCAHNSLATGHLYAMGNDVQRKTWVPALASGKTIGAWALTEPQAGSDAASLQTVAEKDGDHYVLNGQKQFITNGHIADTFVVMAKTDPEAGIKGISAFVVTKGTKGLVVGKKEEKMGCRGSPTSQIYLEDCRVPAKNRLGAEGEGFTGAMRTLDGGRIFIGAMALGLGEAALSKSLEYAKERQQFGVPISQHQAIQFKLADMATDLSAARLLLHKAATLRDEGKDFTQAASMAKLFASEAAMRATTQAIQIHGGNGYITDYEVERYFRDVKLCEIGEGSSEVQRMVIAKQLGLRGA
jgi:alkylation response protein AidB-like acyl-CoA dehydrogenase